MQMVQLPIDHVINVVVMPHGFVTARAAVLMHLWRMANGAGQSRQIGAH